MKVWKAISIRPDALVVRQPDRPTAAGGLLPPGLQWLAFCQGRAWIPFDLSAPDRHRPRQRAGLSAPDTKARNAHVPDLEEISGLYPGGLPAAGGTEGADLAGAGGVEREYTLFTVSQFLRRGQRRKDLLNPALRVTMQAVIYIKNAPRPSREIVSGKGQGVFLTTGATTDGGVTHGYKSEIECRKEREISPFRAAVCRCSSILCE